MNVISVLTIASAILYLYLAVMALHPRPRTITHWFLALSSFFLFCWALTTYFTYNARDASQTRILVQLAAGGLFLFFPFQHLFVRSQYNRLNLRSLLFLLLPLLALLLESLIHHLNYADFYSESGRWIYLKEPSMRNLLWLSYALILYCIGLVLLIIRYRETELHREKRQLGIMIASSATTMVLVIGEHLLHSRLSLFLPAPITPILFAFWAGGYVSAINRYQLLNIAGKSVTGRIVESMNRLVIAVDDDGRPTYFNKRASEYFKDSTSKLAEYNFSSLLPSDHTETIIPVKRQLVLHSSEFSSSMPVIELEITPVRDKFGDPFGCLLIGAELNRNGDFNRKFRLSRRETDVAGEMLNGHKTKVIAQRLGISERTVKAHISNIYKKTGISSRIELINLLKN